jgi:hypothetical protein
MTLEDAKNIIEFVKQKKGNLRSEIVLAARYRNRRIYRRTAYRYNGG